MSVNSLIIKVSFCCKFQKAVNQKVSDFLMIFFAKNYGIGSFIMCSVCIFFVYFVFSQST